MSGRRGRCIKKRVGTGRPSFLITDPESGKWGCYEFRVFDCNFSAICEDVLLKLIHLIH